MSPSYQVRLEVRHEGLNKYRVVTGATDYEAAQKAEAQLALWNEQWRKKVASEAIREHRESKIALAASQTEEAERIVSDLESLLTRAWQQRKPFDWESMHDRRTFAEAAPRAPDLPPEPDPDGVAYRPKYGLLDYLAGSRRQVKLTQARERFLQDRAQWAEMCERLLASHQSAMAEWEQARSQFSAEQQAQNEEVDRFRAAYLAIDRDAVESRCRLVLEGGERPDSFPTEVDVEYHPETKTLVVDYWLPTIDLMPRVKSVRYVAGRDALQEMTLSDAFVSRLYDSVVYQLILRSLWDLLRTDEADAVAAVGFNGWVRSTDLATGQLVTACIASVHASKSDLMSVNLGQVDPKLCFRGMKGIGSTKLHSMAPVAPILRISRSDRRFIQSREILEKVNEGVNLAAMDWEEFEHLVRELFEKEFAASGGEVRVTQASRDGGVDAIAFDPDPIRGGKIVIQAKRYTNTVGVSAVRDLYGTVVNEGATKGILVTTSDYGPDAYEFAKGKPLTLLTGSNLLSLLERHAYKAHIDLAAARRMLD